MDRAVSPWIGKLTYSKTRPQEPGPDLDCDSYLAVALQPTAHGCRNREEVARNLDTLCQMIDDVMFNPAGVGLTRLIAIPEGSIQGFWDEQSDMDQAAYCRDVALRLPGPEIDRLADKARQHRVYLVAQAKIAEPDIVPDRFFNCAFILSPEGEIVLRHVKNVVHVCEGTTCPYDVWDVWSKEVGTRLEDHYPVVKTEIGNLGVAICYESVFPETYRALTALGAEVVVKMAIPGALVMDGTWEATNVTTAFTNSLYVIAPNFGPYYTTPEATHPCDLSGGNSMIVDFFGRIVRRTQTSTACYVPGDIDITKLRHWRLSGMSFTVQMRAELWKQIYERWPDYPKNLYREHDVPRAVDRAAVKRRIAEEHVRAHILAAPRR
jgi:predicted amidohydrolase